MVCHLCLPTKTILALEVRNSLNYLKLMTEKTKIFDVAIVGSGPAGLTASVLLGQGTNLSIALVSPKNRKFDQRSTALWSHSIEVLKKANVWEQMEASAYPLKSMRLVDATNRLFRAPQADFHSSEIGIDTFGFNIANQHMTTSLEQKLNTFDNVRWFDASVENVEFATNEARILLTPLGNEARETIAAKFIIGADGRNSIVRKATGIGERQWSYPQTAIVFDFGHELGTNFTSTEFHTESGPLAIVPHTDKTAGLVWVETPEIAEKILKLDANKIASLAEREMHSFIGKIKLLSPAQSFPLSGMIATRYGAKNCALVGEAAHQFPPIGAQGFNLGLRDIDSICDILKSENRFENAGEIYHHERSSDIKQRTIGVDLMNRSLLTGFFPVQLLRSAGIFALNRFEPLRKSAMRAGVSK